MKALLTAEEMRACEDAAGAQGTTASELMDRAGAGLAEEAQSRAGPGGRFFVVCGSGNNGGDGLVAARRLLLARRRVTVELVAGAPSKGPSAEKLADLRAAGLEPARAPLDEARPGDVLIDAIFGTGLARAPQGVFAEAIERVAVARANGALVISADLPSGIPSDGGRPFHPHVIADVTVAFGALKVAHGSEPAFESCGTVVALDLGLAPERSPRTGLLESSDVRSWIPRRASVSNKGTYGHLLVVAGSPGRSGAAALASLAALRAGVGLVSVACPGEVLPQVLAHAPELMGAELGDATGLTAAHLGALKPLLARKQALVVGPGLARGPETPGFIEAVLGEISMPCLLDADALNALSENLSALRKARAPIVLTPHPGEMARLTSLKVEDIQGQRTEVARDFAIRHGVTLVLKGARTVIATPDGTLRVNATGNPGMATGGSGDVLSGIIGALLAQGLEPRHAAAAGVHVHGLAGDAAAGTRGRMGLIAGDLLQGLCSVWTGWAL